MGRGYGRGPARGYGFGMRRFSPNCDWFPDRPRGWWAMPEFRSQVTDPNSLPPETANFDSFGRPINQDAIDYEISMVEKTIEDLQKEISRLKSLKESF